MVRAVGAGVLYFAGVFGIGLALDMLRAHIFPRTLDDALLALYEAPIMLIAAGLFCLLLTKRLRILPQFSERVAMGLVALVLLLMAEVGRSVFVLGYGVLEHFNLYSTPASQISLFGKILFATLPVVQSAIFERSKLPDD